MTCSEARDLLLEVDPPALQGRDDSELSHHLQSCSACRAVATELSSGQDRLQAGYAALAPSRSAEEVADAVLRAVESAAPPEGSGAEVTFKVLQGGSGESGSTTVRTRKWRRVAAVFAALAIPAAAAATVLVLNRDSASPEGVSTPFRTGGAGGGRGRGAPRTTDVAVAPPEGMNAIVFRTPNPNITVVWLYSGD